MTSAKHRKRVGGEAVDRSDAHFGDAVETRRPKMAPGVVGIVPLIVKSFETSEVQLVPARVIGAFVHEKRREHRASAAPRNPARIADLGFEVAIKLACNVSRWRQFELHQKNSGLAEKVR